MRNTELVLPALVVLGCIFKILHWPAAGFLIVAGGGGLALYYFPFGFRTLAAPKPTDQVLWMTLLAGAGLCLALAGQLSLLMRWPNNQVLLLAGAIACAVSILFGLVLRSKHPRLDIYFDALLIRGFVVGGLAFTLWALFSGKPR